ncbi:ubiquitin carboxyl-terminal hydrolase MINDY-3 homolog [Anopheles bellator]|uniref:ubiquitin carboxyl-terminal hydrolase MINDY-3 homolog n=1 Tax=Anopheles bellator TaxID=139047 RepID=UPI002647C0DA|nr:ubiquitin carboxyl-terminal hydrolase MINDY-3 homolog [Anopheles bellator]
MGDYSASPSATTSAANVIDDPGSSSVADSDHGTRTISKELFSLLWGTTIKNDVFRRWLQGFSFSDYEPSALVQRDGGPCCVIAPVQAYLLKILLMETPGHSFNDLTADKCKTLLIQAVCQILMKCKSDLYRIVSLHTESTVEISASEDGGTDVPDALGGPALKNAQEYVRSGGSGDARALHGGTSSLLAAGIHLGTWTPDAFHKCIAYREFKNIDDVEKFYTQNFHILANECGVLLLLYTILHTKGLESILSEMSDPSEPLIHDTYGCGSQALINLMLTGRAVPHVWDNEQDVGGMKLKGINQQSEIGFITVMEQLQYCTVGFFYKNPKNPVWVMGSDTHLTVMFSNEKRLVSPETPAEVARRVFRQFDADGSNFIPSPMLQDLMCALDLVSEPEYVELMRSRLDPENLGIILLNAFLNEFFPSEKKSIPDSFDLLHYNGIPNSNFNNRVLYNKGQAVLLESDVRMYNPSDPMLTCLQTKWPSIEVNWVGNRTPSLN